MHRKGRTSDANEVPHGLMARGQRELPGLREHEVTVDLAPADDARIRFIGRIHTPWPLPEDCPRRGAPDGPECRIEVFDPWVAALSGLEGFETLEVLYWLDRARRDLLTQNPSRSGQAFGTFAIRSPQRPNPIGTAIVHLADVDGRWLVVRGLDCCDGTPLVDIKPEHCPFTAKTRQKA